ncbi:uroporphyrinogen decarboxylase family protein [Dictyoglomus thermophilum]|uniref:uroporphyrinogen decarboxylase family protein n=1 Tax=Dictyoglomus thermophilum TaxID=14 RepID=UPI001653FAE6|nr:uroporphyrinogen decarboxylase family protein [Dictyoglomus thermophilum]
MNNKNKRLVIPLLGAPGVKLTGTTLKENLTDPFVQFKTLYKIVERFNPDGIFPFMDLTVEAEALGLKIEFPENDNPSVREHPVKNRDALNEIKRKWKGVSGRMITFIKVCEMMAKEFDILKGGYVIGPFTLAGELMGVNDLGINVIEDPDFVEEVVDFTTSVIFEYAKALLETGIDMIAVLEPTAVILSPQQFREFSMKYFKHLSSELKKPVIYHICGNTKHLIEDMGKSGAWGLSLDSAVDLKWASEIVPSDVRLIGNLDPVRVFLQGNPEMIYEKTKELLEKMRDVDNFILSSGCDIPFGTPLENIDAFMQAAKSFK